MNYLSAKQLLAAHSQGIGAILTLAHAAAALILNRAIRRCL